MRRPIKKLICFLIILIFTQGFLIFKDAKADSGELIYSDSEVPKILPRSTWDNSPSLNSLLSWLPQNTDFPSDWQNVDRFIIHDSGCDPSSNPTCNQNINPIPTIQAIYRYHAVTRGWGDIGYNYIIDQQGRIYEGRFGGNGVRGAHTYYDRQSDNYNYGSIGIVLLGNYANVDIPAVMLESLGRLIGWLAAANNLDPQGTKSSLIWNLPKGGFVTPYSGPVVVGHKDIEPGNPDPGRLDLNFLRQNAASFKQKYQGLIYGTSVNSVVYQLVNGLRKQFENVNNFTNQGLSYQKLAVVAQSQLDIFSETRFFKYADGSLLQVEGSPMVYLINGGRKRNLTISAKQFKLLGFDWANIKKIASLDDLIAYPAGLDVIYGPDKSLLKDSSGKVYFIENGKKRWITSGELFGVLGYQWKKVQPKSAEYLTSILDGDNMTYPDGTLVKGAGPTIYLISGGQKKEFLSEQSFLKLGYQKNKIIKAADEELDRYSLAGFVSYKNGTLVRAGNEPTVYLISNGQKSAFVSAEEFLNMGYKWANVLTVSSDELNRYPLAGNVKYADGTVLQKKGGVNVYRVEGGLAKLIPDIATFKKLKLSWAKVLKISAEDFDKLFVVSLASASPPPASNQSGSSASQPSVNQPNIRVAIWNAPVGQSEVVFSGSGPYDVYDKNGNLVASKQSGEQFSVNVTNPSSAFAKVVPKQGTILELVSYIDWSWNKAVNYNKFRGNLELVYSNKSAKLWVVNELPLEEYLKGVAETNQGLAMEYLKTMAVAARTYAYYYQKQGGKYGSDEVYHITNTTSDQLYKGYGREQFASDIVTAAQATFGEIVIYNNAPIVTAYSSGAPELMTAGSKNACSVWGGKYCQPGFEYLNGGVKDPSGTTYSYDACGGGNHCVGLSGAGTRQMAVLGKTYKEILTYYYIGTSVQKIY